MTRWAPDARERIERAATALFVEQGFAETTVQQIAERAGLTRRTFFRHFSDKREVVFGDDEIPALAARMLRDAPTDVDPLTIVRRGLEQVARSRFDDDRARARLIRSLIRSDAGLRERDLSKRLALADAIRRGFEARGEPPVTASLAASVAVEVLHVALDGWLDDPDARDLRHHLDSAFDALAGLLTPMSSPNRIAAGG